MQKHENKKYEDNTSSSSRHSPEWKDIATQRGYGEWKDGWEFPGGKIETRGNTRGSIKKRNTGRTRY